MNELKCTLKLLDKETDGQHSKSKHMFSSYK